MHLEELETAEAEDIALMEADEPTAPIPQRKKPKRKPLRGHLSRHQVLHEPEADGACICPDCGGGMGKLGEDVTEVLDYVPGHFDVIGRKNYFFAGSDAGGDRAAAIFAFVQTAKLNGLNPEASLRDVLVKIANGHTIKKITELMTWHDAVRSR